MPRRTINLIITIIGILLIVSTVKATFFWWKNGERVGIKRLEVEKLERKNEELKNEWRRTQGREFVEKMARDKLNLVKPGEVVLIIPDERLAVSSKQLDERKNWEKWRDLIFKR